MGKQDIAPTPERLAKSAVVSGETIRAGVKAWYDMDQAGPPVIERLEKYITPDQFRFMRDYRADLIRSGIWRSPPAGTYGEITGGDQSIVADLAFTRVIRIERYVCSRLGTALKDLLRNVAIDGATVPAHAPPGWLRPFRRAVNVAMDWR